MERVGSAGVVGKVKDMSEIKQAWITLNRQCNLRCRWCYARGTNYVGADDMPKRTADNIIKFLSEFDLEYISLIGGEPTCYQGLLEVIKEISSFGMKPVLITNGVDLSDKKYLGALISSGLHTVNLSMKGWSEESYFQNTGVCAYAATLLAIKNVTESTVDNIVSFVINCDNIKFYHRAILDAKEQGARKFLLSFEQDFSALDGDSKTQNLPRIFRMIEQFMKDYDKLDAITEGNFSLHQSYPLCIWDSAFIKKLSAKRQIFTSCQLMERSGLIFNTDGALIPCNSMYQAPLGMFGTDFTCREQFEKFWDSERICSIYRKLTCLPGHICDFCESREECRGGCIANWLHHNQKEMLEVYHEYKQGQ